MSENPRTRCPYTLKPLTDLIASSREHIFPDSLGGGKAYWVDADRDENSRFGDSVDAAFVKSPLIEMLRSQHGVAARSGVAEWNLRGETNEGRAVDVTIPHEGEIAVRHRKPIEIEPSGTQAKITISTADRDRFVAQLTKDFARKGKTLVITNETRTETQDVTVRFSIDVNALKVGMLKIAYLAAFEFLGDDFLDDPLNPEWQKGIRAKSPTELDDVQICANGLGAIPLHVMQGFFPTLEPHEHAVTIAQFNLKGPIVAVKLFGNHALTQYCLASKTSDFGLTTLDGQIVICDSLAKTVRIQPFNQHFRQISTGQPPQGGPAS